MLTESDIEHIALEHLQSVGWDVAYGADISPDAKQSERSCYRQVILTQRLRDAIHRLNPSIDEDACERVVQMINNTHASDLSHENQALHNYMVEGVPLDVRRSDGSTAGETIRLIDFDKPDNNHWLAVNQVTVVNQQRERRADIVLYLNGLPVGVIELKNPTDENATLHNAHQQLQTYKADIPALFRTNVMLIVSDGYKALMGSLTADMENFMPWRADDQRSQPNITPDLETLIKDACLPHNFLFLLRYLTAFEQKDTSVRRILGGYHQFYALKHATARTLEAIQPSGNRKIGVVWHTQGSGKSFLMAFYAGHLIQHPQLKNPTIVVITDRNDLDNQLFQTFSACKGLLRQEPKQADSRADLRNLLNRVSGGVIFTTIQKFKSEDGADYPMLTDRHNVIVIADEAHRSHYGFQSKFDPETGKMSYGYAKHLRDALPNASFIGFTGTPIESTETVFGDYVDVYDVTQAIADGRIVELQYESRLPRIRLSELAKDDIDAEVETLTEEASSETKEDIKKKWSRMEAVVGSEKRLALVAEDIIRNFEDRQSVVPGKGMIVCMSRRICVDMYNAIIKLRPDWHSDDNQDGAIKVVMTGSASDPLSWQPHIRNKSERDVIEKRAKDPSDPLKLVIVRDMWLTGFNAPCMHSMYVDKPMQGANLMQAITRVNRVFEDKPAGFIIDYIGIWPKLKEASKKYSQSGHSNIGVSTADVVAVMQEKYNIVRDMFAPDTPNGFNYLAVTLSSTPHQERLGILGNAVDWVLKLHQRNAERETTEDKKRAAHQRYHQAVLELSKAFAMASTTEEAQRMRDEVGFFQAVRSVLLKNTVTKSASEISHAYEIQHIVNRAIISLEMVDILQAVGIKSPNISIFSEEFLQEVQQMKQKDLAFEALRKLMNGGIQSLRKQNTTQARVFSERLSDAVKRYHNNAITTVQIIEELIQMSREITISSTRAKELGLSEDEIAFYDALAANESARDVMGDQQLYALTQELVKSIRGNVRTDWIDREQTRAQMRVAVKRILRKYGYPPDFQDAAIQNVLQQAERFTANTIAKGSL